MKTKRRREWKHGETVIAEREPGDVGQIEYRGPNLIGDGHVFLVRIGKDASRQVVGSRKDAEDELLVLQTELEGGTYTPNRTMRLDTYLQSVFLPWKRRSASGKTVMDYEKAIEGRIIPALDHHHLRNLDEDSIQEWVDTLIEAFPSLPRAGFAALHLERAESGLSRHPCRPRAM